MAQVYRIINVVTNQCYIGITKKDFYRRYNYTNEWWKTTHNHYLKNSVNKYGEANFKVEILEEGDGLDLEKLEIYYIKKFNSLVPNGYNFTTGGNYKYSHSLETLKKISEAQKLRLQTNPVWNKGKKLKKEHIEKRVAAMSIKFKNGELKPWNKGKKIGKMSESSIKKSALGHCKKVGKYTLDDKLITIYDSIKSTTLDGFNPSQVSLCCKNKALTHRGYKFKYH